MKYLRYDNKDKWIERKGYSKKVLMPLGTLEAPNNNTQLQITEISPGNIVAEHYHKEQTELIYVINGSALFVVNGVKYNIEKYDVVIIEPKDIHSVYNLNKESMFIITFKMNYEDGEEDTVWDI